MSVQSEGDDRFSANAVPTGLPVYQHCSVLHSDCRQWLRKLVVIQPRINFLLTVISHIEESRESHW
jgi:hypothetical protein